MIDFHYYQFKPNEQYEKYAAAKQKREAAKAAWDAIRGGDAPRSEQDIAWRALQTAIREEAGAYAEYQQTVNEKPQLKINLTQPKLKP